MIPHPSPVVKDFFRENHKIGRYFSWKKEIGKKCHGVVLFWNISWMYETFEDSVL